MIKNRRMKKYISFILVTLLFTACGTDDTKLEKVQRERQEVVNVKSMVKEIDTGEVLIGSVARLFSSEKYLLIADSKGYDRLIHLFDNKEYRHVCSVGQLGQGPYEITNMGTIVVDDVRNKFYVSDHGKMKIFSYDMDSLLISPELYRHQIKAEIKSSMFPSSYCYINDTLSYARVITPTSTSTFEQTVAKWNMQTGEMKMMSYTHPAIENKRSVFDVSMENAFYVEAYLRHDLLSICDLDGNLKCNIYGPDWNGGERSKISCFGDVIVTKENIVATYSGGDYNQEYFPTKILIFDLTGNYIKTLDVGYKISDCCYDETNNRIVMAFDDEIQFGYLNLNTLM